MRTLSAIGNSAIRRDDLAAVLNGRRDSVDLRKSQEAEIEPLHAIPRTREVILTPPKTPELPFEEREFSRRGVLETAGKATVATGLAMTGLDRLASREARAGELTKNQPRPYQQLDELVAKNEVHTKHINPAFKDPSYKYNLDYIMEKLPKAKARGLEGIDLDNVFSLHPTAAHAL
ncbi:MAG: hypothetical protein O2962_02270, partial [Cyanobacteria bacterium]|nr:hypothetical protein [Cyanobacteriota bacterium]